MCRMRRPWLGGFLSGSFGIGLCCSLACGDSLVASPFAASARGNDAGVSGGGSLDAGTAEPGEESRPEFVFGAPCVDDAQCDDGIDCTLGVCDPELGVCRFSADDARCDDGVFCNGSERCELRLGCRPGPPTTCTDATPCTIDVCDEATRSCLRRPRDVDGDGDVDANCEAGRDCNDLDPDVSSQAPELCGDGVDDDCDGEVDEAGCQLPRFDTCADPLLLTAAGSYVLEPSGAQLDYGAGCAPVGPTLRELILELRVPAGPARDYDLLARTALGELALATIDVCGGNPVEERCRHGSFLPTGEGVSRLRLHSLAPGSYPVYVWSTAGAPVQLEVAELPGSAEPANRSCATAQELTPGEALTLNLALAGEPLESGCGTNLGDLFYTFTLAQAADVRLSAQALDDLGLPRLSLRDETCVEAEAELSCSQGAVALVRRHSLAAGTYRVALSSSAPGDVQLLLELGPPTAAPATDRCSGAPELIANRTQEASFVDHSADIEANCAPAFTDAAWVLELAEPSDVLLSARFSPGDVGAVALVEEACGVADVRGCSRAGVSPARISEQGVPAGRYRVVLESARALPATLTAAVRPARARTLVPNSDDCIGILTIPTEGGFFQGNTQNHDNDFSASCDFATPNGSPDQLLHLVLDRPRRVLLDMRGSNFDTLLSVRQGAVCPGTELLGGCSVGAGEDQSYLDLELPAGEYFLQVDGYAGSFGAWFLDVFLMDP
ncbi:MAG: hypothetical protein RL033_5350 [Pseudomonadota bacterium]